MEEQTGKPSIGLTIGNVTWWVISVRRETEGSFENTNMFMPSPCLKSSRGAKDQPRIINTAYEAPQDPIAAYLSSRSSELRLVGVQTFLWLTPEQPLQVEILVVPIFQMRNWRRRLTCQKMVKVESAYARRCFLREPTHIPNPSSQHRLPDPSWWIFILTFPALLTIWVVLRPMTRRQKSTGGFLRSF